MTVLQDALLGKIGLVSSFVIVVFLFIYLLILPLIPDDSSANLSTVPAYQIIILLVFTALGSIFVSILMIYTLWSICFRSSSNAL